MKINTAVLIIILLISFDSFAQSKKEQLIKLANTIDSFKISNEKLRFELDSLTNFINHQTQESEECLKVSSLLQSKYNTLKQIRISDSISYLIEKEKYITQLKTLKDSIYKENQKLSIWISKNLNILTPTINSSIKINQDLTQDLKKKIVNEYYWLGKKELKGIKNHAFYIELDLSDEDALKTMMISDNYLILSYHLNFGSDGNTMIINLQTMEIIVEDIFIVNYMLTDHIIKVEKDYYEDEGHVWEYGEYYIETGKYKFLSKTHY